MTECCSLFCFAAEIPTYAHCVNRDYVIIVIKNIIVIMTIFLPVVMGNVSGKIINLLLYTGRQSVLLKEEFITT